MTSEWLQRFLDTQPDGSVKIQTIADAFTEQHAGQSITKSGVYYRLKKLAPERLGDQGMSFKVPRAWLTDYVAGKNGQPITGKMLQQALEEELEMTVTVSSACNYLRDFMGADRPKIQQKQSHNKLSK